MTTENKRPRDQRLRHIRTGIAGAHRSRRQQRKTRRAAARDVQTKSSRTSPHFLRFAGASLLCSTIDQVLAWLLFALLRRPMADIGFLRILVSNVTARCVSLTLNYTLNHRLVFSLDVDDPEYQRNARRESLPRFVILSAVVLTLSTLGVFAAHTFWNVEEWQAKIVVDLALFFLNYNVQRTWVFNNDVTVSTSAVDRRNHRHPKG